MQHSLRRILMAISLCIWVQSGLVRAADYPERPIRLVVPYSAGGITDAVGRIVATSVGTTLGQTVVVDNRAGAGGVIGSQQVARSAADGYTLLLGALSPLVITPITNKELAYDPFIDLKPVMQVARSVLVLVVPPSVPVHSVQELVQLLKANPGTYSYATAGVGTPSHLAGELFKTVAGVDVPAIHYKGTGQLMPDLLSGRTHFTIDSVGPSLPHIQAGSLRALAIAGETRSALLPDVPSMVESGFAQVNVAGWYGVLAPAGTPDAIVEKLNRAFANAVQQEDIQRQFRDMSLQGTPGSPQDFAQLMRSEYERWTPIVSSLALQ